MGLIGEPDSLSQFLGGAGTENPGYDQYPATKAKLLADFHQLLEENAEDGGSTSPNDLAWLSQRLPEGTYQDQGEVFAALTPVIEGPPVSGAQWVVRVPIDAIAAGTRLRVSAEFTALLMHGERVPLDPFSPGEYVLSPQTAPLAAAASRPPAPGTRRFALAATVVFFSSRDQEARVSYSGRSRTGEMVGVQGTVRCWVRDPSKLVLAAPRFSLWNSPSLELLLSQAIYPQLGAALASLDPATMAQDRGPVEAPLRKALEGAGLGIRSLDLHSAGSIVGMGGAGMMPADVLARMPPEARAMMQARMNEAMQRRAGAPGAAPPGSPPIPSRGPPASPSAPVGGGAPPGSVLCGSCHAPNPVTRKFCGSCGAPITASRKCSSCGHEVPPGIKFCGSCGARMA